MHHRDGIRPRPIDDHKPYMIIKDLAEAKKGGDKERIDKITDIEKELYNIIEYYDKIKKNQIPKAKIINEKNDKNEVNVNYNINNNIIYTIGKNEEQNQNNSQYVLNLKLSEYKRSDSYIIYSSKKQDELNTKRKAYEATEADKIYLSIRQNMQNVMSLEELENIIIDLENNCTNEKDDKINEESAKKIIETKYSKYISLSDSIINHFKDRRTSIKKSLIRKKWHKNKSTDKFLTNTFKKRTGDKRQTRKSNQNKEESLNKIIEAQNYCKTNLLAITNDMKLREDWNKEKLKLEECIFLTEIEKLKDIKIVPASRIKENNYIKEKIEKNIKIIKEKENIKTIVENENKINNINKNANKLSEISISTEYKNKNNIGNSSNININKNEDITSLNKSIISDTKSVGSISLDNSMISSKKGNEKKIVNNKNQSKNKNNEIFPNVSLNCLRENDLNLKEENDNNENSNKNNKKNKMRMRIRINRNNQIVIDRYIQKENDFDPFTDSYNDIFTNYRSYEVNQLGYLNSNNFEKLYHSYNLNKMNNLNIFYDSDDEDANGDIKQFSNSYKQFLKNKRAQIK